MQMKLSPEINTLTCYCIIFQGLIANKYSSVEALFLLKRIFWHCSHIEIEKAKVLRTRYCTLFCKQKFQSMLRMCPGLKFVRKCFPLFSKCKMILEELFKLKLAGFNITIIIRQWYGCIQVKSECVLEEWFTVSSNFG